MTPSLIPALPANLDGARCDGPVNLRYEDVSQEGRLLLLGAPQAIDQLCWPSVMQDAGMRALLMTGIIPIRARMVIEGGQGPLSAIWPARGEGAWHRAAVRSSDGQVQRLLMVMWAHLWAREGWTLFPPDPTARELPVGRVYVEHIYTRLWADKADRRVLDVPGWTPRGDWPERRADDVAPERPEARPRHTRTRALGVLHTDPNNHVNSLVYLRIFEEEALVLRGDPAAARRVEVVWRKPFFAGETLTLSQWVLGDEVHGLFLDEAGSVRARVAMSWEEPAG
jgi:hypothetical protein